MPETAVLDEWPAHIFICVLGDLSRKAFTHCDHTQVLETKKEIQADDPAA
jgi:hypothetical protein